MPTIGNLLRDCEDIKNLTLYITKELQPIAYRLLRSRMTGPQVRGLETSFVTHGHLDSPGNWGSHLCLLIGFIQRENKLISL